MKILVTGDTGYIGTKLCESLIENNYEIKGIDTDFFKENDLKIVKRNYQRITNDIRRVNETYFDNIETIIHLAAISNDPLGEFNQKITYDINNFGTVQFAKKAKKNGVKNFIYVSTQSVYGISKSINDEIRENTSNINPITAYAKSKYFAEKEINKLNSEKFKTIIFRPATVFGPCYNFRSDIVFNNLCASSYLYNKIIIKSDGTPWRPILYIKDIVRILILTLKKINILSGETINLGYPNKNFQVLELANIIKKKFNSKIIIEKSKVDERSYKVNFDKVYKYFKDEINFDINLEKHAEELFDFFDEVKFNEELFTSRKTNRLKQLKYYETINGKLK